MTLTSLECNETLYGIRQTLLPITLRCGSKMNASATCLCC